MASSLACACVSIAATNAVKLVFNIDEGPKVKVGDIKFVGNKAVSNRKLVRSMHNDRPYAIPLYITEIPVFSKTYDKSKLDEDLGVGVSGIYKDLGYFKGKIKLDFLPEVAPGHVSACHLNDRA